MFGKIGDMLGKLQEVKKKVEEIKELSYDSIKYLHKIDIDIIKRKIQKLEIATALQSASKEELQEQLLITINKAIEAADKQTADEMKSVAGGLIPPGLL